MKVLVTGVKGQLGHDVMEELARRGQTGVGVDVEEMDITDAAACARVISQAAPDAVIHCAAWTAVDAAEDSPEKCRLVNACGTENIARVCRERGCRMMYISTDYVFDGQGTRPWTPDDPVTQPLNVYGQTKWEGEQAVRALVERAFIIRISWAFGCNGRNFVRTMLKRGKAQRTLCVVNDQIGTPTYTADLARLLVDMIGTEKYGTYHATNEGGYISWYDFACEIFRQAGVNVHVAPVASADYPVSRAKRPFNSRLDKRKLAENGFAPLPDWRDALARYLEQMAAQEPESSGGH